MVPCVRLSSAHASWTADEACPVACGTVCGDDLSWTYTADGDKKDCVHVAEKPNKRCDRAGDDGRSAREACALTCDNCGKERVGVDATGREVRASVACKGVCRESCEGC